MSDDADDFLSFGAAPIPAPQPKLPKQKSTQRKKSSSTAKRSQTSQTAYVYGEELFQAAWKPEKSIVVCFHPFTKNYIRFAKDEYEGRFALKYNIHADGSILLYYFNPPFHWEFDREAEFEIIVDDSVRVYGPFVGNDSIERIKLKIMGILRMEALSNKKKSIQELHQAEVSAKQEEERLENEKEKLTEQLADAGILSSERDGIGQTEIESKTIEPETEIVAEIPEKKEDSGATVIKDRKGTTLKITPIVY